MIERIVKLKTIDNDDNELNILKNSPNKRFAIYEANKKENFNTKTVENKLKIPTNHTHYSPKKRFSHTHEKNYNQNEFVSNKEAARRNSGFCNNI